MSDLIATDVLPGDRDPSPAQKEALRVMEICNACRYCEGLCATFQSISTRAKLRRVAMD